MRTLVIGLGNTLLTDDGVGLRVVRALTPRLAGTADVDVAEDSHGGLRLMERMVGYDRAIVVDAMTTGAPPGTIRRLAISELATRHSASSHDVDLATALAVGRGAGASLPDDEAVVLFGVEADEVETFGEMLTPPVEAAVPLVVEGVLQAIASNGETR
jgi:hydrogenase maturation protease